MLAFSRRESERFRIRTPSGEVAWVTVLGFHSGGKVVVGVQADRTVIVEREELVPWAERPADTRGKQT